MNPKRVVICAGLCLQAAAAGAASVDEWRADIDRIVADIKATHPAAFAKAGEMTFLRATDALKQQLPAMSEEQRVARAMALVALIGDGHTQLAPASPAFSSWYPFRLYQFEDGYFLSGVHKSVADLAGAKVVEVAGRPTEDVVGAARGLMGADNRFDSKERLYAIHNSGLMRGLGFADGDGSLRVKLKLRNGKTVDREMVPMRSESASFEWTFRPEYWGPVGPPEDWISAYKGQTVAELRVLDSSRPAHLQYRRAFHATALANGRAYYIQSNVVGGTAEESLPAFFRRTLAEVDRIKPEHLIVDIRYNFGGDGSNVPAVLHQFIARKFDPPWKNLYLLTGRKTFSAGVLWTADFLTHMRPTVVGEPAGAPLNTYGDVNSFAYPKTGLRMTVSFERHQKGKSTDRSTIIPVDHPASFSFAEYSAGRDPAVDPIVSGEDVRSIPAIAASAGAAAAFAAYQDRKTRFGRDDTWRPTSEIDLRTVMRELDDQGRMDAAIEVARLNTQLNPQEWRTWMNLGDLQMRAGRKAEAIENYRRSVNLNDPTNFNADRLNKAIEDFRKESKR
jgi:hypothetical protein